MEIKGTSPNGKGGGETSVEKEKGVDPEMTKRGGLGAGVRLSRIWFAEEGGRVRDREQGGGWRPGEEEGTRGGKKQKLHPPGRPGGKSMGPKSFLEV